MIVPTGKSAASHTTASMALIAESPQREPLQQTQWGSR